MALSKDILSVLARRIPQRLAVLFPSKLPSLGFPISGDGKIHRRFSTGRISHAGDRGLLLVLARLRCTLLGKAGAALSLGASTTRTGYSAIGGVTTLDAPSTTGPPFWLGLTDTTLGEQLRQALLFPAWGTRLHSRHRETFLSSAT